jgi:hypothetical protein
MPKHVRVRLEGELGDLASPLIMRAKPVVVNGAPRFEVRTNGDRGLLLPLQTPEGAQLVPRIECAGSALLDPTDMQDCGSEVDLIPVAGRPIPTLAGRAFRPRESKLIFDPIVVRFA